MRKRFWTAVLTVALVGGLASFAMAKEEKAVRGRSKARSHRYGCDSDDSDG
jgi:hypothetical protein